MDTTTLAGFARHNAEALAALNLEVPEKLSAAIAAADHAIQPPLTVDLDSVIFEADTPAAAKKHIDKWLASRQAIANYEANRGDITDVLNRKIIVAHNQSTLPIIEACRPLFEATADAFTDAFNDLRHDAAGWGDPAALLRAGGQPAESYRVALEQVPTLDALREIRHRLPGHDLPGAIAIGVEFCNVTDTVVAEQVCAARTQSHPAGLWGAWLSIEGVTGLVWRDDGGHRHAAASCPRASIEMVKDGWGLVERKVLATR